MAQLEEKIEAAQKKQAALLETMSQPEVYSKFDVLSSHQQDLDQQTAALETLNKRWEEIVLELDALKAKTE